MHKPLVNPYLPVGSITRALISGDAPQELVDSLKQRGIDPVLTESLNTLPSPLSKHADMQMVNVCEGVFVCAPGIPDHLREKLRLSGYELIEGSTSLGSRYPFDVAYNCAVVGKYAFLNARHTDDTLLKYLTKCGIRLLTVRQGYAKCSTCILSREAVITADASIHEKAVEEGIDSLLIPPQRSIALKGYNYGFIGGSTGMISNDELAFLGDFQTLDSADSISKFLRKHGIKPLSLTRSKLEDLGGLIPLCSV